MWSCPHLLHDKFVFFAYFGLLIILNSFKAGIYRKKMFTLAMSHCETNISLQPLGSVSCFGLLALLPILHSYPKP